MKKIILLTIFLTGCTNIPLVQPNIVKAPEEIMFDCAEYVKPKNASFEEFMRVVLENKKVYAICNAQNKAKKDFINRQN